MKICLRTDENIHTATIANKVRDIISVTTSVVTNAKPTLFYTPCLTLAKTPLRDNKMGVSQKTYSKSCNGAKEKKLRERKNKRKYEKKERTKERKLKGCFKNCLPDGTFHEMLALKNGGSLPH